MPVGVRVRSARRVAERRPQLGAEHLGVDRFVQVRAYAVSTCQLFLVGRATEHAAHHEDRDVLTSRERA